RKLAAFIAEWLTDVEVDLGDMEAAYTTGVTDEARPAAERIRSSAELALHWFQASGIVLDDGKGGAYEGFGTEIYPDGSQRLSTILRADCIGEIALPYFLDGMLNSNERSFRISERLSDYVFDHYICRDLGD